MDNEYSYIALSVIALAGVVITIFSNAVSFYRTSKDIDNFFNKEK